MSKWEIILGIVFGLIVNEITDVSPWLAKRLVRWSACRWTTNPELAEAYAEEWAAIIDERPGKLFKLMTAMRFAAEAACRATSKTAAASSHRISAHAHCLRFLITMPSRGIRFPQSARIGYEHRGLIVPIGRGSVFFVNFIVAPLSKLLGFTGIIAGREE